jgi:FkbM family methyltransferase
MRSIRIYPSLLVRPQLVRVPNPIDGSSLLLRPGTADQDVYHQTFVARECDLAVGSPRVIVDAGAHIGLTAAFFAARFPEAQVIAIEPESSNFSMLRTNTQRYPNVRCLHAGLWSRRGPLRIRDQHVATWSFQVSEVDSTPGHGTVVPATTMTDILSDNGVHRIDLLKMDIEGAELEVLLDSQDWIGLVDTILVELHDSIRPGCTDALMEALRGHTFEISASGEYTVIRNIV